MDIKIPELLCPAGSEKALEAAIEGGADAVYLGGALFNARINAENFSKDALSSAVKLAHSYNVKIYQTLNTAIYDRELSHFLIAAEAAADAGVDALIVADMGAAELIRKHIPSIPLHASTQMSGHNADFCKLLSEHGYSRAVLARELSLSDMRYAIKNSPIEIEVFVHGALCVCQSGQCLFSSLVGGRSGNRGECAQPCRLPYSSNAKGANPGYPLSLKDLSLAEYVPELIDSGVSSLKIEGRMKSPEYVLGVSRIWRKLLDQRRAATPDEMRELAELFSRGGFTDGYFTGKINRSMLGVRSESDKQNSRELEKFTGISKKIPLDLQVEIIDGKTSMALSGENGQAIAVGTPADKAINRPLTKEDVLKNVTKFGGTPYSPRNISIDLGKNLILPVSALNSLRRDAINKYSELKKETVHEFQNVNIQPPKSKREKYMTARFSSIGQITDQAVDRFDILYLPLHILADTEKLPKTLFRAKEAGKLGVIMPPIVYDSAFGQVTEMLEKVRALGCTHILTGNLGTLKLAEKSGMKIHGDYRFNVTNSQTVAYLESIGVNDVIASPELTLPRLRDLQGNISAIIYGRIPLMTLEKCVTKEIADCNACATGKVCLKDRMGVEFPVMREWQHRNIIYNSIPTSMSDRQDELARNNITSCHFVFSIETPEQENGVITAFDKHNSLPFKTRRI